jgi:glycosyltransferase involved in cell wall biosynthesis
MKITVFTPTYNRGYIIYKLYESLRRQKFYDFEWLVIDDGSTDNTKELFQAWTSGDNNNFPVFYTYTENGGKHRAINKGVKTARGELFFIVDSDDYLTDNALEKVSAWFETIRNDDSFCGIAGLKGYTEEKMIGTSFQGESLSCTSLERKKNNIVGDKAEVFRTEILRKYPFPEFNSEKFITENAVWYKIAKDGYNIKWYNEIIYIANYLDDGLTKNISKHLLSSPKGDMYTTKLILSLKEISWKEKASSIFQSYRIAKANGINKNQLCKNIQISKLKLNIIIIIRELYRNLKKLEKNFLNKSNNKDDS